MAALLQAAELLLQREEAQHFPMQGSGGMPPPPAPSSNQRFAPGAPMPMASPQQPHHPMMMHAPHGYAPMDPGYHAGYQHPTHPANRTARSQSNPPQPLAYSSLSGFHAAPPTRTMPSPQAPMPHGGAFQHGMYPVAPPANAHHYMPPGMTGSSPSGKSLGIPTGAAARRRRNSSMRESFSYDVYEDDEEVDEEEEDEDEDDTEDGYNDGDDDFQVSSSARRTPPAPARSGSRSRTMSTSFSSGRRNSESGFQPSSYPGPFAAGHSNPATMSPASNSSGSSGATSSGGLKNANSGSTGSLGPADASPGGSSGGRSGKKRSVKNREQHNMLEKNRRAHLKTCFEELQEAIPGLDMAKPSTVAILQHAKQFIETLHYRQAQQQAEIDRLQQLNVWCCSKLDALGHPVPAAYLQQPMQGKAPQHHMHPAGEENGHYYESHHHHHSHHHEHGHQMDMESSSTSSSTPSDKSTDVDVERLDGNSPEPPAHGTTRSGRTSRGRREQ
ncbi:hypothetical protein CAOG_03883 [Capsaspora owczarzaki ATCC 30864]|uniref:BHLH domain-containing protein n=1 Tax=Capsaspora owczarzaki (strain ATCC 30864) TaxID=595528 RepID=A0A0D2UD83_CAPO3|nr:hypothetical protein CAOG_03883 [Capsaspora owczarzaki ATCC 30864]KJE93021.1 hypothetical protein CAOG_003883 [Capsaspora owczarzaki ATCC 30864]|eukprot:XP_004363611.1 hypothetical protein CAOG_03883 [Capsaspora owczarzaki ATCC 30864]